MQENTKKRGKLTATRSEYNALLRKAGRMELGAAAEIRAFLGIGPVAIPPNVRTLRNSLLLRRVQ